jgi:hypothetical protein
MTKRTAAEGKMRKYKLLRFWVSLLDAIGWAVLIFATVAMVIAIGTIMSPDIAKFLKTQDLLDDIPRMIIICFGFYIVAIVLLCIGEILSALLNISEDALYIKDLVDRKLVDTRPDIQDLQEVVESLGQGKIVQGKGGGGPGIEVLRDYIKQEFKKNESAQKVTGEFLLKTQQRSTKERRVLSDFLYNHLNEIQSEITSLHDLINVELKQRRKKPQKARRDESRRDESRRDESRRDEREYEERSVVEDNMQMYGKSNSEDEEVDYPPKTPKSKSNGLAAFPDEEVDDDVVDDYVSPFPEDEDESEEASIY